MYQPLIKFHPYPAIITQVLCIFVVILYTLLIKDTPILMEKEKKKAKYSKEEEVVNTITHSIGAVGTLVITPYYI